MSSQPERRSAALRRWATNIGISEVPNVSFEKMRETGASFTLPPAGALGTFAPSFTTSSAISFPSASNTVASCAYGYFGLVRLCRLGHDVPWVKA